MNRPERTVESLRLLQDWSKWLISLETVVCISLWPKLTSPPPPSGVMYAGWMIFWASIIVAAILVLCISVFVRRVDESGDRDIKVLAACWRAICLLPFGTRLLCFEPAPLLARWLIKRE